MTELEIFISLVSLLFIILLSGFFSCAETALMTANRYRLRHKARLNKRFAVVALLMLERPDQLLGMLLIGNCIANIVASAVATLLAAYFFGNKGVIVATLLLTLAILVLAEVVPKTLAAFYPETVVKIVAIPIFILLKLFYPLIWFVNIISHGVLSLFRIRVKKYTSEPLSKEELRSLVYETKGRVPHQYLNMLLGILDLNKVTVNDVMVLRQNIVAIDLNLSWPFIQDLLSETPFDVLPLYHENINQIVGILTVTKIIKKLFLQEIVNKETLLTLAEEPYFIPENTPLNIQLDYFKQKGKRTALVVDEYGEIQGMVTLADILEEIVGEFTTSNTKELIQAQEDGSFLVEGFVTIREINRVTKWSLPTRGPKTLSGLIIEWFEALPAAKMCVLIKKYPIEIIEVSENRVKLAKIFPALKR